MPNFPSCVFTNRRKKAIATATLLAAAFLASTSAMAAPKVVATIKPVHSLVAGVMQGVGTPDILIDGAASPHDFALKPSQASQLQNADVVFWIGEGLETSLAKALSSLAGSAKVVELSETPGLTILPFRESNGFGDHDHDEHEHADHDGHEHESDHSEAEPAAHGHVHHGQDPHIWLSPENAELLVGEIAQSLSEADPDNAATYSSNAKAMKQRISTLAASIDKQLTPVRGRPYVVFHDAYHYFEDRFSVPAAGAISLNPETPAGADRIAAIRDTIKDLGVVCVFSEPQFTPKLVGVVLEGSNAKTAVLDPLGSDLENGPGLYEALLKQTADAVSSCLSQD